MRSRTLPSVRLSAAEAAEALEVSKVHLLRLVKAGHLRAERPLGTGPNAPFAFDPEDVERLRAIRAGEIGDVLDRVEVNAAGVDPAEDRAAYRRGCYLHAIREVTKRHGGTFHMGLLRSYLPEDAAGPEGGALITALVRQRVIRHTGHFGESGDRRNRHGSTPAKVYELVGDLP